jgi:hypothetical protein
MPNSRRTFHSVLLTVLLTIVWPLVSVRLRRRTRSPSTTWSLPATTTLSCNGMRWRFRRFETRRLPVELIGPACQRRAAHRPVKRHAASLPLTVASGDRVSDWI